MHIIIRLEIERLTPVNCKQIVMQFLHQDHGILQLIQLMIVIMYYLLLFFCFVFLCIASDMVSAPVCFAQLFVDER